MRKRKNPSAGLTRRHFLKSATRGSAAVYWLGPTLMIGGKAHAAGPALDPTTISKYADPLVIPPAMP